MRTKLILLTVCAAAVLAIGPAPRYIEELAIGGGYGDAADGGADFDKTGAILTNGNIGVGEDSAEDHAVSVTSGTNNLARLDLNEADADHGGTVWFDGSNNALRFGTRDGSSSPMPAIEIARGSDETALLGTLNGIDAGFTGSIGLGSGGAPDTGHRLQVLDQPGITSGSYRGVHLDIQPSAASSSAATYYGIHSEIEPGDSNDYDSLHAGYFSTNTGTAGSDQDLSEVLRVHLRFTGAGSVTTARGINIVPASGSGAADTVEALRIGGVGHGSTNNYAIITNAGLVHFGDDVATEGSLDVEGDLNVDGGDVDAGTDGGTRGVVTAWDGSGGSAPGVLKLASPDGTVWYFFVEDDGTFKVHSALPTANGQGTIVGMQF